MPHAPQPLLKWPSNGVYAVPDDAFVTAEDTIYYIREKHFGNPARTLGPYHTLDRLKTGCEFVIKGRCLALTLAQIHDFLKPLALWELVDFAIAPTSLFKEKTMPYDIIAQPNKEVAAALRQIPENPSLPLFVVRVTKANPPFIQKREGLEPHVLELVKNDHIWGITSAHLDLASSNEHANLLFQHLCNEFSGATWMECTGKLSGQGLFGGILLGDAGEVRAIVHVRCQYAP